MWQKAIIKTTKNEHLKFLIGKTVWVEGPPSGSDCPSGHYDLYGFNLNDPATLHPYFGEVEAGYKTNIVQDGYPLQTKSIRLGLMPYMLELLPEFCELPPFIYFSEWSHQNA
jgi:hypothetical protein